MLYYVSVRVVFLLLLLGGGGGAPLLLGVVDLVDVLVGLDEVDAELAERGLARVPERDEVVGVGIVGVGHDRRVGYVFGVGGGGWVGHGERGVFAAGRRRALVGRGRVVGRRSA